MFLNIFFKTFICTKPLSDILTDIEFNIFETRLDFAPIQNIISAPN